MRGSALTGGAMLAAAVLLPQLAAAQGVPPRGPQNSLNDIRHAIRGCWKWPPLGEVRSGMTITIRISFKRSGELFGARITHETPNVSDDERSLYYGALTEAMKRCSPLPVTESLGGAIAGRVFTFRFTDNRRERKV